MSLAAVYQPSLLETVFIFFKFVLAKTFFERKLSGLCSLETLSLSEGSLYLQHKISDRGDAYAQDFGTSSSGF